MAESLPHILIPGLGLIAASGTVPDLPLLIQVSSPPGPVQLRSPCHTG